MLPRDASRSLLHKLETDVSEMVRVVVSHFKSVVVNQSASLEGQPSPVSDTSQHIGYVRHRHVNASTRSSTYTIDCVKN